MLSVKRPLTHYREDEIFLIENFVSHEMCNGNAIHKEAYTYMNYTLKSIMYM